jgi:hypothetical protein
MFWQTGVHLTHQTVEFGIVVNSPFGDIPGQGIDQRKQIETFAILAAL